MQTTNAQGQATLGNWVLGPSPGIHIVTATSVGTIPATFVATATAVPPKSVVAVAGATQTGNTGTLALQAPTIEARDSSDNPMPGVEVVFAVTGGGGSVQGARQTTNAQGRATVGGWILGSAPGANTLTASVIGNPAVTFSATGVQATPAALQVVSGSGQTAFRGNFVPTVPALRVVDGSGNPVAGTIVTYTPTAGSGTVTGGFATSDFAGMARPKAWRLGPTPGPQTLNATAGAATPASFAATADPAPTSTFNIEIRFTGNAPTQAQQTAFNEAVATWTSLIVQDLPDIPVNQPAAANGCFPTLNETIDDLVIYAELVPIDGVGNILGSAGPCLIRTTGLLTIVGRMRFDTADLDNLESQGRLKSVILHEMGHVLGIGTLWQSLNLLEGAGGGDPTFTGSRTLSAMLSVLQPGQTFLGPGVPVENTGGAGTRDGHWRESIFDTELMTALNDATHPFRPIPILSLRHMGYLIDDFLSDDYSFALAFRAPGATRIQLREVPLEDPIMVYQPGRGIVRVIPRQ